MRGRVVAVSTAAALCACATDDWARVQEEFAQVRGNCRLQGTRLERDARDKRLLRLVFLHRSNMALQAEQDGRLACAEAWARENGYEMTTSPPDMASD
jgi:hypothetical protein